MLASMEMLSRLNNYDQQLFAKVFRQRGHRVIIPLVRVLSRSGAFLLTTAPGSDLREESQALGRTGK